MGEGQWRTKGDDDDDDDNDGRYNESHVICGTPDDDVLIK